MSLLKQMTLDSPVALWPMQDGSGTTVKDIVAGNDLTTTGGPTWVTAPWGRALSFDGVDDLATRGVTAAVQLQTWTVLSWIRLGRALGNVEYAFVIDGTDSDSIGRGYQSRVHPSGYAFTQKGSGDGSWEAAATVGPPAQTVAFDGTWHLLVGTNQNGGGATAIGASFDDQPRLFSSAVDTQGVSYTNSTGIVVGGNTNGALATSFSKLDIAYVAVYGTVLSEARVKAIYQAGIRSGVVVG